MKQNRLDLNELIDLLPSGVECQWEKLNGLINSIQAAAEKEMDFRKVKEANPDIQEKYAEFFKQPALSAVKNVTNKFLKLIGYPAVSVGKEETWLTRIRKYLVGTADVAKWDLQKIKTRFGGNTLNNSIESQENSSDIDLISILSDRRLQDVCEVVKKKVSEITKCRLPKNDDVSFRKDDIAEMHKYLSQKKTNERKVDELKKQLRECTESFQAAFSSCVSLSAIFQNLKQPKGGGGRGGGGGGGGRRGATTAAAGAVGGREVVGMEAEVSGKEYLQMLETFKFFLQHHSDGGEGLMAWGARSHKSIFEQFPFQFHFHHNSNGAKFEEGGGGAIEKAGEGEGCSNCVFEKA
jgi:hypothetical protein